MANRKRPPTPEYEVGYQRPPKGRQFKTGQSGNPKGRPKGSRPVSAILHGILNRRVPVTENGKTKNVPVVEVVIRRLANEAMRSDPSAIKLLLALNDRYVQSAETNVEIGTLLDEDRELLAEFLSRSQLPTPTKSRKRNRRINDAK